MEVDGLVTVALGLDTDVAGRDTELPGLEVVEDCFCTELERLDEDEDSLTVELLVELLLVWATDSDWKAANANVMSIAANVVLADLISMKF